MHQSTHPPKQTKQQQKPLEEQPLSSSPSPSFSGLPTTSAAQPRRTHMDQDGDTMFEFYKDFNSSEMCAAEDIFFCGKLLPLRQANEEQTRRPKPTHRRKLESFDEFNGGTTIREYSKGSSESRRIQRTTSQRPKPKWYVIVFGSVKVPGEMEMSDIRSRQMRRQPPPLPQQQPLKTASVNGGSAWRLLKSLSCKGHDIAASVML